MPEPKNFHSGSNKDQSRESRPAEKKPEETGEAPSSHDLAASFRGSEKEKAAWLDDEEKTKEERLAEIEKKEEKKEDLKEEEKKEEEKLEVEEGEVIEEKGDEKIEEKSAEKMEGEVKQKMAGAGAASAEDVMLEEEKTGGEGLGGRLDKVLKEANLSRKHLYFCCFGLMVIVFLVIGAIFGVKFFLKLAREEKVEVAEEEIVEEEVKEEIEEQEGAEEVKEEITVSEKKYWVDPSLYSGILLGELTEVSGPTGVEEGIAIGEEKELVSENELVEQVEHLKKLWNALDTDLFTLLDQSQNRSWTLEEHIKDLEELYQEGLEKLNALKETNASLAVSYEENKLGKETSEEQFFISLKKMEGLKVLDYLTQFIEVSGEQVEIKANYKAREKLISFYQIILQRMKDRISDIKYNREALIKGVKVVDIAGSDIDLILQEAELSE